LIFKGKGEIRVIFLTFFFQERVYTEIIHIVKTRVGDRSQGAKLPATSRETHRQNVPFPAIVFIQKSSDEAPHTYIRDSRDTIDGDHISTACCQANYFCRRPAKE